MPRPTNIQKAFIENNGLIILDRHNYVIDPTGYSVMPMDISTSVLTDISQDTSLMQNLAEKIRNELEFKQNGIRDIAIGGEYPLDTIFSEDVALRLELDHITIYPTENKEDSRNRRVEVQTPKGVLPLKKARQSYDITLVSTIAIPNRYIRNMGRDGLLPSITQKENRTDVNIDSLVISKIRPIVYVVSNDFYSQRVNELIDKCEIRLDEEFMKKYGNQRGLDYLTNPEMFTKEHILGLKTDKIGKSKFMDQVEKLKHESHNAYDLFNEKYGKELLYIEKTNGQKNNRLKTLYQNIVYKLQK